MIKETTLVLVPTYPRKFEPGVLVAYKRKKIQPKKHDYNPFYLTDEMMPIPADTKKNWIPVEPYLVCDDDFEMEDLLIFSVSGRLCAAYFDELLGAGIDWVKKVVATPEQIGKIDVTAVIKNGESSGKCEIEIKDNKISFTDLNIYIENNG
jgi:hypothetical protein